MVTATPTPWTVRGTSFGLWLLAAGSLAFWGLKLSAPAPDLAATAAAARSVPLPDPAAIGRLLGASANAPVTTAAVAPSLASRLVLVGVVASERSGQGAALIAIDGKPAKPFRVGKEVEDGLVLQSVQARHAVLAPAGGGAPLTLEMPLPKTPGVTGTPLAPVMPRSPPIAPSMAPSMAPPAPATGGPGIPTVPSGVPPTVPNAGAAPGVVQTL